MTATILQTFRFPEGTCIAQAEPRSGAPVSRQSPGLSVMTDLTEVRAATVRPDTSLSQARQLMIYQGVRLLFVVDKMPCIEGLITSTDLEGDRAIQLVAERGVRYEELMVSEVMSPLSVLDAIDYDELAGATVESLIRALLQIGRNHMLVFQKSTAETPPRIRGVISRAQIERQLGESL